MNKTLTKDSLIVGFALFAVFFGAGNLIFPPIIGFMAGDQWAVALLALVLAAVILPVLAVIAVSKAGGSFEQMTKPVGRWFYVGFNLLIMIGIGVMANIPRTAATTHELAIAPLLPSAPIQLTVFIFFALVLYLAIDKSSFVDKIGKFLTPALVVILIFIVVKGLLDPLGVPVAAKKEAIFAFTFTELYFSADLLTGLLCAPVFVAAVRAKGYEQEGDVRKITRNAALITALLFFIVYGGLMGSAVGTGALFPDDVARTALLSGIVTGLLGTAGTIGLSVAVVLACLTTAVGLTVAVADFIETVSRGKIKYKWVVIVVTVAGVIIGSIGVDNIISFAGPIFYLVYPAGILITILGLLAKYIPNPAFFWSVLVTLAFSALQSIQILGVTSEALNSFINSMPLSSLGLGWILPALVGYAIGLIVTMVKKKGPAAA